MADASNCTETLLSEGAYESIARQQRVIICLQSIGIGLYSIMVALWIHNVVAYLVKQKRCNVPQLVFNYVFLGLAIFGSILYSIGKLIQIL